jgi:hypothetical protein
MRYQKPTRMYWNGLRRKETAMIVKKEFYNIKCDCCGRVADEMWHDTEEIVRYIATESGWLLHWDKAYCPDCYDFDGNDNLIIKKGE